MIVLWACKPIPPPPMIAMHADTAAAPKGTTSVVLVVGTAGAILGGGGWGVALRGERQVTARTALGVELSGGTGEEPKRSDEDMIHRSLVALRGYGRWMPRTHDWVAVTYSIGISHLDTGLVTGTAQLGTAVSYVNDYVAPFAQLGLAAAVPLRRGTPFGDISVDRRPLFTFETDKNRGASRPAREGTYAKPELFLCFDVGAVGLLADGKNRVSLDFGLASGLLRDEAIVGISVADTARNDR
jgi:hypothetical protein